jgi:hypothetical protein
MVWIVINATNISESLNRLIDRGNFKDAQTVKYYLDNFLKKLKSLCQTHGGSVHLSLYERVVLEVSVNAAEQIPNIIENYMPNLKSKMGIGIGMSFEEANEAAQKSLHTKEIEMYESKKEASEYIKSELLKDDDIEPIRPAVDMPPNVFDPELPDSKNVTRIVPEKRPIQEGQYRLNQVKPTKPKLAPNIKEQEQGQKTLIDNVLDELLFPKEQIQQQAQLMQQKAQQQMAMQQQMQAQQEKEQATQHLQNVPKQQETEKDELEGTPVIHYEDESEKDQSLHKEGESEDIESSHEEDEHDKVSLKLLNFLGQLKEQMPDLMQLHASNPEAFKQVMSLINKMLKLSKHKIKKSDISLAEELEKNFKNLKHAKKIKQAKGTRLPIGTLKGRKIKVMVNDKPVWRQVASGIVSDSKGVPISVKSRNLDTE